MTIPEQFLMDNPNVAAKPFQVFQTYNTWLKKQYLNCPTEKGKEMLQAEADRYTSVYNECIEKLFFSKE